MISQNKTKEEIVTEIDRILRTHSKIEPETKKLLVDVKSQLQQFQNRDPE